MSKKLGVALFLTLREAAALREVLEVTCHDPKLRPQLNKCHTKLELALKEKEKGK